MKVKKLFDLSDKTIVLTGAAGHLGKNYVDGLSQFGANVVLSDINYQGCKKIEKQIKFQRSIYGRVYAKNFSATKKNF